METSKERRVSRKAGRREVSELDGWCMIFHAIPYHTILYYNLLYYTIPYHTIPSFAFLYYTILYYTIAMLEEREEERQRRIYYTEYDIIYQTVTILCYTALYIIYTIL